MIVDIKDDKDLVEHFKFLDRLRDSGRTNMFGAAPYLEQEFGMTRQEAPVVLGEWQRTFDGTSTAEDRASLAAAT